MRKAHVRYIEVKNRKYVQVVQYSTKMGEAFRVIQSFGREGQENNMRAELYAAAYNALLDVANSYVYKKVPKELENARREFLQNALAVFGFILGARTVQEILG